MNRKISYQNKSTKIDNCLKFKSLKFDVAVTTTIWPWVTENQSTDWISNPLVLVEKKWTAAATRPIWFISTRPDHCAPFRVKLFCDCQKAPLYHNAAHRTIFTFLRFSNLKLEYQNYEEWIFMLESKSIQAQ